MKALTLGYSLLLVTLAAAQVEAGCGLLRRGGCSDPHGAVAGCGLRAGGCSGCGQHGGGYGLGYASAGYAVGGAVGGAVGYGSGANCAAPAYSAPAYSATSYASPAMSSGGAGTCSSCGNAMHAADVSGLYQGSICAAPAMASTMSIPTQRNEMLDCGPVTTYRVVMEPQYATETRYVESTEYQDEVRTRVRTVTRQVPVEVQDYRTTTVMVPTSETKTVEYQVLVPQTSEKTVELIETVPVWNEVSEEYTVKVPTVVEVPEEYTVRVPTLRNEEFTYTVYVPTTQTQTRMHTYTNAVPVTKTRAIQVARPVTRTQTVTKDYGHWEERVEEVVEMTTVSTGYAAPATIGVGGCGVSNGYGAGAYGAGGCGQASYGYSVPTSGCGSHGCGRGCRLLHRRQGGCGGGCGVSYGGGCGTSYGNGYNGGTLASGGCGVAPSAGADYGVMTSSVPTTRLVSRRVWVPNVTTEEVSVVENVMETQEVTYTDFEQQTSQVPYECTYIVYAPEQRTGTRQVVDYVQETRTRSRKVVQYTEEARTRTRKVLSYKQESRTQTVPVVNYTTETRTKEVVYTVNVPQVKVEPFTTTRYETVQEEVTEDYTVRVAVSVPKESQVQVCRMVPKLVPVTIYPCSSAGQSLIQGSSDCSGCGPAPTLAPSMPVTTGAGYSTGCTGCGQVGGSGACCR